MGAVDEGLVDIGISLGRDDERYDVVSFIRNQATIEQPGPTKIAMTELAWRIDRGEHRA